VSSAKPPPDDGQKRIIIGEIVAPHGVRGEVRVLLLSDFPDRFLDLERVRVRDRAGREQIYPLESARPHQRHWLLKLTGCDTREDAEALRGAVLVVRPAEQPPLPPDEYYVHEIVGLRIVTTAGEEIGVVEEVLFTGGNDVYVTARGLIPATSEVVQKIDVPSGVIVIEPLPGMLDGE
jgi:16S rRNA processing protein RimM